MVTRMRMVAWMYLVALMVISGATTSILWVAVLTLVALDALLLIWLWERGHVSE